MLLRRITKHVKDQNWFAVFLDFFIVVVGVLLAMQISNWNDERALHERQLALTDRLTLDFGLDAWDTSSFYIYHSDVLENALNVLNDLNGQSRMSDEALLIAAYRATQFTRFSSSSTYNELLSTGGLGLVVKSKVGSVATVFYETSLMEEIAEDGKSSEYRRLYRKIIPIDVQLTTGNACGDGNRFSAENVFNEVSLLSYECSLQLPAEQMTAAAQSLRQHTEIIEPLRHRVAALSIQVIDLGQFVEMTRPYRAERQVLEQSSRYAIIGDDQ